MVLSQGFSDLGYVEGGNIILENRFRAEIPERFISLAAELAALRDFPLRNTPEGATLASKLTASTTM